MAARAASLQRSGQRSHSELRVQESGEAHAGPGAPGSGGEVGQGASGVAEEDSDAVLLLAASPRELCARGVNFLTNHADAAHVVAAMR